VYVFVPAQGGSADIIGAGAVTRLPQLSKTAGGMGATAAARQATVDAPGGGIVKVVGAIV
jgi:hypothetical protein